MLAGQEAKSRYLGSRLDPYSSRASLETGFASFLLQNSYVPAPSLARAERACLQTNDRIDRVLVELGLLSERDAAKALAAFLGYPVMQPADFPSSPVRPDLIRASFVRGAGLMPVSIDETRLSVAVTDPLDDEPVRAIAYLTDLQIDVRVACPSEFLQAAQSLYDDEKAMVLTSPLADRSSEDDSQDVQRLRDNASEAPVVKLVNQIVKTAIEAHASDVHLEPLDDFMQVRLRVDGVLRSVQPVPSSLRAAVVSRIKIMAKLDIAERRRPQDGRLRISVRGIDIDFRISTIPTAKGESVVMRILDRSRVSLEFESLGFEPFEIAAIRRLLSQPNGVVLITGPTGSGKTTTLYAALKELNQDQVKIFTVEDPVEYQLEGVNQVQVQPAIGLDFPHALRSILRQDPDVIMIGEIRDAETARIAVQAALTGHLVLSTLHTNSASSAITRLVDMGIEPFLLGSTIRGVVAQRLVRCRCGACAVGLGFGSDASGDPRASICDACGGSGFSGRSTIAEVLLMDGDLQQIVNKRGLDVDLESAARAKGMRTMYEAGLAKVELGVTTQAEVLRVTEVL